MTTDIKPTSEARSAPEETRRRILEATRELYVRYGSRGTTTREVASRACVISKQIFSLSEWRLLSVSLPLKILSVFPWEKKQLIRQLEKQLFAGTL